MSCFSDSKLASNLMKKSTFSQDLDDFKPEHDVLNIFRSRGFSEEETNKFLGSADNIDYQEPVTIEEWWQKRRNIWGIETNGKDSAYPSWVYIKWMLGMGDEVDISISEKMLLRKLRDKAFSVIIFFKV